MVVGKTPFGDAVRVEDLRSRMKCGINGTEASVTIPSHVPEEVAEILRGMLMWNAQDRWLLWMTSDHLQRYIPE